MNKKEKVQKIYEAIGRPVRYGDVLNRRANTHAGTRNIQTELIQIYPGEESVLFTKTIRHWAPSIVDLVYNEVATYGE